MAHDSPLSSPTLSVSGRDVDKLDGTYFVDIDADVKPVVEIVHSLAPPPLPPSVPHPAPLAQVFSEIDDDSEEFHTFFSSFAEAPRQFFEDAETQHTAESEESVSAPPIPVNLDLLDIRDSGSTRPSNSHVDDDAEVAGSPPSSADAGGGNQSQDASEAISDNENTRELWKCIIVDGTTFLLIICGFVFILVKRRQFEAQTCINESIHEKPPELCEPCGSGTVIFPLGGEFEQSWPVGLRAGLYLFGVAWCFLGVAIICDIFMCAIEQITSQVKTVWKKTDNGCREANYVRVWNATIANLSLMALGSSAPEILLNVYEMVHPSTAFFSGELGISTIVGSAAFNLFIITAVCISAIPAPDVRKVEQTDVFCVTATSSIFAYLWIVFVLRVTTPDKVDVWEALLTLSFFPLLLIFAYKADLGVFESLPCLRRKAAKHVKSRISTTKNSVRRAFMQAAFGALRSGSGSTMSSDLSHSSGDPRVVTIGFKRRANVVSENQREVVLRVVANRALEFPVNVLYTSFDEQAEEGVHYQAVEGVLKFLPGEKEQCITVPLVRQDWQDQEGGHRMVSFSVELTRQENLAKRKSTASQRYSTRSSVRNSARNSGRSEAEVVRFPSGRTSTVSAEDEEAAPNSFATVCMGITRAKVFILRDSEPGCLSFQFYKVACTDTDKVIISVNRTQGASGTVTCNYRTVSETAVCDLDYIHVEGVIEFLEGVDTQTITVPILQKARFEDHNFRIVLENPSSGAILETEDGRLNRSECDEQSSSADGKQLLSKSLSKLLQRSSTFGSRSTANRAECACEVVLLAQGYYFRRLIRGFLDKKWWSLYFMCWREQIRESFYCGGCPSEQMYAEPIDWFFHILSLIWKVFFALIPPPIVGVSWVTFSASLMGIGCLTSLIKDLAELLGCCFGSALWGEPLPAEITAITLVALGTSLPDVMASKLAAESDDTADNSVGNVTGSNSVNVFLGLGLPWTIGAIYWEFAGSTDAWKSRMHRDRNFQEVWGEKYPSGGLIVPADTLGFNVATFVVTASICLVLLMFRRWSYGGELGGPMLPQRRDSFILVLLWLVYLCAAATKSLGLY